jgi:dipeptidase E
MKFYLSSYKLGNQKARLKELAPTDQIAIIPNALDFRGADDARTLQSLENKKLRLSEVGLEAEVVDLKDYFGKQAELRAVIERIGNVFVLGGNVFVLRQAMKLSGLDEIITDMNANPDFLYAGYSAAGCVLAPSLKPYSIVDDITLTPYPELQEVIWEGLGLVDFAFMPHWDSDHPESAAIEREIEYCEEHGIKYKAVRDGEVLVF